MVTPYIVAYILMGNYIWYGVYVFIIAIGAILTSSHIAHYHISDWVTIIFGVLMLDILVYAGMDDGHRWVQCKPHEVYVEEVGDFDRVVMCRKRYTLDGEFGPWK